jgi:sulfide dehydrogenase cytochrome subunit
MVSLDPRNRGSRAVSQLTVKATPMKLCLQGLAVVCAISLHAATWAVDLEALIESCNGCHGTDGISQWNDMPTIAGIDAFVHSEALWVYQDQGRPCASEPYRQGDTGRPDTSMCDVAAGLSDVEIEAIAAHYAALPFVPAQQDFDPTLAEKGMTIHERECRRCHSEGGSNPDDEASILAGQWMGYLETTFAEYAAGQRDQPAKMKEKLDPLSADDIRALVHYYASQQ